MSDPQLVLFDLAPDYWGRLMEKKDRIMQLEFSASTREMYGYSWSSFEAWCKEVGAQALPATAEHVLEFVTWGLYERKPTWRLETMSVILSAIRSKHIEEKHLSPVTAKVREFVASARRDLKEQPRRAHAMTPELLRRICVWYVKHSDRPIYVRDHAMLLTQFAAGWRESEIVSLDRSSLAFVPKKAVLTLGSSKSDQTGRKGRVTPINVGIRPETDPVRTMRAWLKVRGDSAGPLFCYAIKGHLQLGRRLNRQAPNYRLQHVLGELGVDTRGWSSHSLRAGMVTTGILRGASESAIMLRTGHANLQSMQPYIRAGAAQMVTAADPLAGVL